MIAEGKDKLEWTRKVDQSKVEELRSKLSGPDYKEKLGVLVSDLYKLAFQTYKDIPRGPIKVKITFKKLFKIKRVQSGRKDLILSHHNITMSKLFLVWSKSK